MVTSGASERKTHAFTFLSFWRPPALLGSWPLPPSSESLTPCLPHEATMITSGPSVQLRLIPHLKTLDLSTYSKPFCHSRLTHSGSRYQDTGDLGGHYPACHSHEQAGLRLAKEEVVAAPSLDARSTSWVHRTLVVGVVGAHLRPETLALTLSPACTFRGGETEASLAPVQGWGLLHTSSQHPACTSLGDHHPQGCVTPRASAVCCELGRDPALSGASSVHAAHTHVGRVSSEAQRAPPTRQFADSQGGAWHTAGAQQVCVSPLCSGSTAAPPRDNSTWSSVAATATPGQERVRRGQCDGGDTISSFSNVSRHTGQAATSWTVRLAQHLAHPDLQPVFLGGTGHCVG